jgi:hypothetical protein
VKHCATLSAKVSQQILRLNADLEAGAALPVPPSCEAVNAELKSVNGELKGVYSVSTTCVRLTPSMTHRWCGLKEERLGDKGQTCGQDPRCDR